MRIKIIIWHLFVALFSGCFLCNNIQAQTLDEIPTQEPKPPNKPATTPKPNAKQIQCEQRYKDGKEAYDSGDYETALIFFKKGLAEKCNNIDFQDYIDMCNMKLEKQSETEQKNAACSQYLSNGKNAYNAKNYATAKVYFSQGLSNNCNNTDFQPLIADCDSELAYQNATLTVSPTEIEFDATGGTKTINVSTNYSSWHCSFAYSWLSVTKHSSYIILTCIANTSESDRTDFFLINAGSKTVKVNIKQKGQAKTLDLTEVNRLISRNINSSPTNSYDNGKYKGHKNSDGKRSGLGAYRWDDYGAFYFGGWSNGNKNGYGIYIAGIGYTVSNCPDCKYYVGNWSNSDKLGQGTCYDAAGKLIYNGMFTDDKPNRYISHSGLCLLQI
ncbi:MAG: hypothetical protein LBK94_03930 [Prevotellaceae bacterium]|jgi:hypothetical protein|nr:hypothetical protein [Prevotellaceae bacterium]